MLSYYGRLSSEVYDLDKPVGRSFGDIEFYEERLKSCEGPILEPATGTGRILIPLLEKGFDIEGFDSSQDMLRICRQNSQKRGLSPRLFEAKMESFSQAKKYKAIIVPTGSFLLLHKREDSLKALKNFYEHLCDGGRLIVDLLLPKDVMKDSVSTRMWECPNGDIITLENKVIEVDYVNQFTISLGRYEKWRQGGIGTD